MAQDYTKYFIEDKKPSRKLSSAYERIYDIWGGNKQTRNEFFTDFRYTKITGIGYEKGVTRRDPSKILKIDGTYYVWYTRRKTKYMPVGTELADDEHPAKDWDLADIYYATSPDGFNWTEKGCAVSRTSKGKLGDRSICTPDILVFKGKYYLFCQTYTGMFGSYTDKSIEQVCDFLNIKKEDFKSGRYHLQQDYCDIFVAVSDSPDGPFKLSDEPIIKRGNTDAWDGGCIHDPYPLIVDGRIRVYYKATPLFREHEVQRFQGVVIADNPLGPYERPEINPVLNSGHETFLFPYKTGIVAVATFDGLEFNTIQYSEDGFNFEVKAHIDSAPMAAGPFCPDIFADNKNGNGITWGLCHMKNEEFENDLFLARFECDLSRLTDRQMMLRRTKRMVAESYFEVSRALPENAKDKIIKENVDTDTIL